MLLLHDTLAFQLLAAKGEDLGRRITVHCCVHPVQGSAVSCTALQWLVSTTQSYSRNVNASSENGERSPEPCAECSMLSWSLQGALLVPPVQGCRAWQMYRVDLPVEQAAPLICEMLVCDSGACQERGHSSQLSELPHLN